MEVKKEFIEAFRVSFWLLSEEKDRGMLLHTLQIWSKNGHRAILWYKAKKLQAQMGAHPKHGLLELHLISSFDAG